MIARIAALAAALIVLSGAAPPPEPDSYRMENFRAPVPATLKGAEVVDTAEAEALWRAGNVVFVDVLPKPPKPELPKGTVWNEPPHRDIPGSVWLPDVGFGALNPTMEAWYRDSLKKLTTGDKTRRFVVYCRSECWMSWNAARRAVEWGYTSVVWYPGGVEEWEEAKLPLEERIAEPRPASSP
jgi:PQQ-dependent catabolism-associated CXXCW motif protein